MALISRLQNLAPDVVSKLNAKKVRTQADLWDMIGPDFQEGIARVAELTEITPEQLREILKHPTTAVSTKAEGWRRFFSQVRRHWGEVLALIIAGILLAFLIRNAVQRRDTIVVKTPNGLPAFHIITVEDVQSQSMFAVHDSLTSTSDVIGRYLLQPVSAKAVLLSSQLAPSELKEQLAGRQVLTLPVKPDVNISALVPGGRVRLLFSPRKADDPKIGGTKTLAEIIADLIVDDVIVLSATRQADSSSITFAFKNQEDLTRAFALSTTSDILISEFK